MERHLRLAEARGSLLAPNSPVQDVAVEMTVLLKEREHQKDRWDMVKRTILLLPMHRGIEAAHSQWPEFFPEDFLTQLAFARATDKTGEFDPDRMDDSLIKWKTKDITPEEDDEISRWIAERENGSVSMADLDRGWR